MKLLFIVATFAMAIGLFSNSGDDAHIVGWQYMMEGIAIYASILIITLAQVSITHYKDVQLKRVVELCRKGKVPVLRGRDGSVATLEVN